MELTNLFRAIVEFMSMGKKQRINIFMEDTDLDRVMKRISETTWVKEKHGHIISVAEVVGVFVH